MTSPVSTSFDSVSGWNVSFFVLYVENRISGGEDMSEEDAESLGEKIEQAYPDCDVEVNYGGQPIYYCVVSVE